VNASRGSFSDVSLVLCVIHRVRFPLVPLTATFVLIGQPAAPRHKSSTRGARPESQKPLAEADRRYRTATVRECPPHEESITYKVLSGVSPNTTAGAGPVMLGVPPSPLKLQAFSPRELIAFATRAPSFDVAGGPAWTDTDRWDVRTENAGRSLGLTPIASAFGLGHFRRWESFGNDTVQIDICHLFLRRNSVAPLLRIGRRLELFGAERPRIPLTRPSDFEH
jgi:hypothetical protein